MVIIGFARRLQLRGQSWNWRLLANPHHVPFSFRGLAFGIRKPSGAEPVKKQKDRQEGMTFISIRLGPVDIHHTVSADRIFNRLSAMPQIHPIHPSMQQTIL